MGHPNDTSLKKSVLGQPGPNGLAMVTMEREKRLGEADGESSPMDAMSEIERDITPQTCHCPPANTPWHGSNTSC